MSNSLLSLYKHCLLCPRKCGVDRTVGSLGFCGASAEVSISTYQVHKFEEPPISGSAGSGAIFFSYCTARCAYCQNYNFSHGQRVKIISIDRLCEIMLELQNKGCHNINFVTPTHYIPSVVVALGKAKQEGLKIPIVYNTSGYECLDTLKLLDGLIDIYMPDAKYSDDALAKEHSQFEDYSKYNILALKEMYKQVGNLELDANGVAKKGLIIRHLVLPGYLDNTYGVLKAISEDISKDVYISLMSQYSPTSYVKNNEKLSRRITSQEYKKAKSYFIEFGFKNGWTQEI